jgi:peptidoglycan lytic transglycosylase G
VVTDELGLFNERHSDYGRRRQPPPRRKRRRSIGKRITIWFSVLVVLGLIAGGVWFGLTQVLGIDIGGYDDYSGAGERDVMVEIPSGASIGGIAGQLHEDGVVASTKAFTKAAEGDSRARGIQPGFYQLRTHVSGKDALTRMLAPDARKGQLQLRAGLQFDDLTKPDGSAEPGIVSRLSKASCAELNGKSTCVTVDALRQAYANADLANLGVPDWAAPVAAKLEPNRRLEGLIMPGVYDVKPGSTAVELWRKLISESSAQLQALGMPAAAADTGFTPYQVLVMASLIEREAIKPDFKKVSRVTYNRLEKGMKLEYDSTVNYVLDRPAIRTKPDDRGRAGAYNTYANTGLPPGPISAPSKDAIEAAAKPEAGPWLFFVRCQKDGTSCFAETAQQHEKNVKQAQDNGAY